jgi:hypothetical protein
MRDLFLLPTGTKTLSLPVRRPNKLFRHNKRNVLGKTKMKNNLERFLEIGLTPVSATNVDSFQQMKIRYPTATHAVTADCTSLGKVKPPDATGKKQHL